MNSINLLDIGNVGSKFTWSRRGQKWNNREGVFQRLDRALASA